MSLETVREECHEQLKQLGRTRESLKLIAVSKLQPIEKIRRLHSAGHNIFAENYVQEALLKQDTLKDLDIEWHFIGTLQKNKVKMVVGKFVLVHSVDSFELARAISNYAEKIKTTQKVLIQVNLAQEITKGGFDGESLLKVWSEITALPGIEITGLMTMPPLTDDPEDVRPYFRQLRELQTELLKQGAGRHPLHELSMGTSHDYHVAIEEGATIVRLGTILFGERPRKN
ncbi:YggS family pyridoxal phosphate-dependent enzyme [Bdellovibrio sp. HCB337]|uniref:YggS family pyridoxal phosphate-dependent enzyme n=1 Tax=Bdellovibrio sp. HCB337 TaxID=3394358 RepID=UPI0039A4E561